MNPTLPPFVQELFDDHQAGRGIDPIDDPAAREWLLAHPETLSSFAALRGTLAGLARQRTRPRRWHPIAWPLAAAALALLLLMIEWGDDPPPSRAQPLPRPDFASTGGVLIHLVTSTEVTAGKARQAILSSHSHRTVEHYRCPSTASTRYVHAKTVAQEIIAP